MKASTELRAVVDAFAARHAAARVAAGADRQPILVAFKRLQSAARTGDHRLVADADRALHHAIVTLAGVAGLDETWLAAADAVDGFRIETLATCWPDLNVLFEAHRSIVDAICAGNIVAAEDAARSHLDAVWYRLGGAGNDSISHDDPLARCCTYPDFHLQQPVTLGFLAKHLAQMSPGHLARLFRDRRGMSFTQYLRELRLQKADGLLTTTAEPIGRIAKLVGYTDASRFADHFRRRYGLSPRAHRHRYATTPDRAVGRS